MRQLLLDWHVLCTAVKMQAPDESYIQNAGEPWHPQHLAFWSTPHPNNVLYIDAAEVAEVRRLAWIYRTHLTRQCYATTRKNLIEKELDKMGQEHVAHVDEIHRELQALRAAYGTIQPNAADPPNLSSCANCNEDEVRPESGIHDNTTHTTISSIHLDSCAEHKSTELLLVIAPGDPGFTVKEDLRMELVHQMYADRTQWLPSYGSWYREVTLAAMQRRGFPRELRGDANFKNSTSERLMRELIGTIVRTTDDVYSDTRHLPDTQAALCLLNAYYCTRVSVPPPQSAADLLANLDVKLETLVADLKSWRDSTTNTNFEFTYTRVQQRGTIAPINHDATYDRDFFSTNRLYQLLASHGVARIPTGTTRGGVLVGVKDSLQEPDMVYAITTHIFGPDIPPFANHQWNLRVGIVALQILILAFLILETTQPQRTGARRRLHLDTLLGSRFKRQQLSDSSSNMLRRSGTFSFLVRHYVAPMIAFAPHTPASALFPGVVLAALEARSATTSDPMRRYVNLTASKYNDVLEVITQRLLLKEPHALLAATTSLRLNAESGMSTLLSRASPASAMTDIIREQFGGCDDYDKLYFIVLGFLPVAVAVV
uniref:Putative portal-capping protein n=1 Tax=Otarine gammaherpesvirus 4 TaxID=2801541 RepID=A0A889IW28_9GAMA|nr:putative portal-capping protein [Otarine gammaherpesvirus 4]